MTFDNRKPAHRRRVCERFAARQFGLFSLDQARARGLDSAALTRLLESGRLCRRYPRVYQLSSFPSSKEQDAFAVCLWAGEDAVVSHLSAGGLWELEGCNPTHVEVTVPRGRRTRAPGGVTIHQRDLDRIDRTKLGIIPITTPIRTLIDLAAVLPEDRLEFALEDARRRRLVEVGRLARRMQSMRGGCPGIATLRHLLSLRAADPATGSRLEVEVDRLIRHAGLPIPLRQFVVTEGSEFVARVDFAYPQARVAVEAEGYGPHSGRQAWEYDTRRRNHLQRLGWRVIVVTWQRLRTDPHGVVNEIADFLGIERLF